MQFFIKLWFSRGSAGDILSSFSLPNLSSLSKNQLKKNNTRNQFWSRKLKNNEKLEIWYLAQVPAVLEQSGLCLPLANPWVFIKGGEK